MNQCFLVFEYRRRMNIKDDMLRFYRLKSEYESKDKSKCINCHQSGGSVFQSKYDERAEGRVLLAKCGHTVA
ncbi:MAG: hypothetical protein WA154_07155, partial [Moraxellaceae bacterium]